MLGDRLRIGELAVAEGSYGLLSDWDSERLIEAGFEILLACFILVVGWYLSKLVVRLTGRTVARQIERPSVTRTILRGVRVSVLLLTLAVVASIFGISGGEKCHTLQRLVRRHATQGRAFAIRLMASIHKAQRS